MSDRMKSIDDLVKKFEIELDRIRTYSLVSSELGIVFTDFQLGQIEGLKVSTTIALEYVNELKEELELNKLHGDK